MFKLLLKMIFIPLITISCVLQNPSTKRTDLDEKDKKAEQDQAVVVASTTNAAEIDSALNLFYSRIDQFSQDNEKARLAYELSRTKVRGLVQVVSKTNSDMQKTKDFAKLETANERKVFLEQIVMPIVKTTTDLLKIDNLRSSSLEDFGSVKSIYEDYSSYSEGLIKRVDSLQTQYNDVYSELNEKLINYKKYSEVTDERESEASTIEEKSLDAYKAIFVLGGDFIDDIYNDLRLIELQFDSLPNRDAVLLNVAIKTNIAIFFEKKFLSTLKLHAKDSLEAVYNAESSKISSILKKITNIQGTILSRAITKVEEEIANKSADLSSFKIDDILVDEIVSSNHKAIFELSLLQIGRLLEGTNNLDLIAKTQSTLVKYLQRIKTENNLLESKQLEYKNIKNNSNNDFTKAEKSSTALINVLKTFPDAEALPVTTPAKVLNFNGLLFELAFRFLTDSTLDHRGDATLIWMQRLPNLTDAQLKALAKFKDYCDRGMITPEFLLNLKIEIDKGADSIIKLLQ